MQTVTDIGGIFRGIVEGELFIIYPEGIVLREIQRDVYIAVELTGRSTIRVVSHLQSERTKGMAVPSQWEGTDIIAKLDKRVSDTGWI